MNIIKNTSSPKKIIIASIIFVLLGVAMVAALEKANVINLINNDPAPYSGPTNTEKQEQKKTEKDTKQEFVESPDPADNPEVTPTNSVELSAKQESNSSVTVLTKLYGVSDGTCTLTVSKAGVTHTQTAQVIYQPDFSSCAGFSISRDKLGAGSWTIQLTVSGETPLQKSISLDVK
ncbi:MAG: hypothetical protein ABIR46_02570 [Candidatus Saccharimonadales bacterium]